MLFPFSPRVLTRSPFGPRGPSRPCAPFTPFGPANPSGPGKPGFPGGPSGPTGPGVPCGRRNIISFTVQWKKKIRHKLKTTHIRVELHLMAWSIISYYTLVGLCKKKVTPLIMHWSYIFLALTNRYDITMTNLLWTHERHPKPHSLRWASQCQLAFLNILEKNYSIIRRLNCTWHYKVFTSEGVISGLNPLFSF